MTSSSLSVRRRIPANVDAVNRRHAPDCIRRLFTRTSRRSVGRGCQRCRSDRGAVCICARVSCRAGVWLPRARNITSLLWMASCATHTTRDVAGCVVSMATGTRRRPDACRDSAGCVAGGRGRGGLRSRLPAKGSKQMKQRVGAFIAGVALAGSVVAGARMAQRVFHVLHTRKRDWRPGRLGCSPTTTTTLGP